MKYNLVRETWKNVTELEHWYDFLTRTICFYQSQADAKSNNRLTVTF